MHILDIAQNSLAAGATEIRIVVRENTEEDSFTIEIEDNGRGMPEDFLGAVLDPFFTTRTTRKVGLGLPLLCQAARACDGDVTVDSEEGKGTRVAARFRRSHWDRAPLGDIASTIAALVACNPSVEIRYEHCIDGASFCFDTRDTRRRLEDIPLSNPLVADFVKKYVAKGEDGLRGR